MSTIRRSNARQYKMTTATELSPSSVSRFLSKAIAVPAHAHRLAGFRQWAKSRAFPERGQICFLDKEIYIDMSPEELESHARLKAEVGRALLSDDRRQERGLFYPDGTLLSNVEANLSTEPDGTFVSWEALESSRVRLVPREGVLGEFIELEGTPDWVMEIVSKNSVRKDTKVLREQYHRARIPEYWLIDPRGRTLRFTVLIWQKSGYKAARSRDGWQFSPAFDAWFRLTRHHGRMGLWFYTLHINRRMRPA